MLFNGAAFYFGPSFNFGVNTPLIYQQSFGAGSFPVAGNFLLLDGSNFLLLDGTNFLLLGS